MTKNQEKAETKARLLEELKACGPDGDSTLVITNIESRPSSSGITQYLEIRVWSVGEDGRPNATRWLTRLCCEAFGYRFNKRREALAMGGYGYCRATQLASQLHSLAGFPIRIESHNFFGGPCGWYPKKAVAA